MPLQDGGTLDHRIRYCVALYAAQGLPCLFRMPSFASPALAQALDTHGFAPPEGETTILYRSGLLAAPQPGLELTMNGPTAAWLDAQARLAGDPPRVAQARRDMLAGLAVPAAFGGLRLAADAPFASLGYAAIHDGLACINMVATDPAARRRGLARRLVEGLLGWAHDAGAEAACLQVASDNAAAIPLYRGLGFQTELYRYHYRRLDQSKASLNCSAASRA